MWEGDEKQENEVETESLRTSTDVNSTRTRFILLMITPRYRLPGVRFPCECLRICF